MAQTLDGETLVRHWMERAALGVEVLAVAVIVVAIAYGTVRFVIQVKTRSDAFQFYKSRLGRSLLLGLELLVAADIVRTVSVTTTMVSVTILGLLVLIRTFLSWALVVEMEGRWPWQGSPPNRPARVTDVREAA